MVFFQNSSQNKDHGFKKKSYSPMSLKRSEGILLLRIVGFSVSDLLILVGFLAKFEASSVPKTFLKRNKPKKVKVKSMLL